MGRSLVAPVSRDAGFTVMDVSVEIVNDQKVRRLYREQPALAGAAFVVYMATMGESWKAGRRIPAAEAWPSVLPFDAAVLAALKAAKLLDGRGLIAQSAWKSWFQVAHTRREAARERWRRSNQRRADPSTNDSADAALEPRGSRAATVAIRTVPLRTDPLLSVPTEATREIPPPPAERGRRSNATNPRAVGSAPRQQGTNGRATGESPRQVRSQQKRGSTGALGDVLRRAAAMGGDPT